MEFDQIMGIVLIWAAAIVGFVSGYLTNHYRSKKPKYDGVLNVETNAEGGKMYSLDLIEDIDTIDSKHDIIFKVNPS